MTPTQQQVANTSVVHDEVEATNGSENGDLSLLLETWIDKDITSAGSNGAVSPGNVTLVQPQTQLEILTSREAFASRLQSFRPLTYFCKPTSLSPIVCARFGWINTSVDMLKCVTCQSALVVTIHPKVQKKRDALRKLVQAYQTKLATAHKPNCPFRLEAELHLHIPDSKKKTDKDNISTHHDGSYGKTYSDNSQLHQQQQQEPQQMHDNVVPSHLSSILPRDVWNMIEHPAPIAFVQARFNKLVTALIHDDKPVGDSAPKWQFPPLQLPKDLMLFGCEKRDATSTETVKNSSNQDDGAVESPKQPDAAIGWDKETLLSRLEEILRPHLQVDEVRAQPRAQGAWESFYEGMAVLALFGWVPAVSLVGDKRTKTKHPSPQKEGCVSLQCPVCLSSMNFNLEEYDPTRKKKLVLEGSDDDNDDDSLPKKRRRLHSRDGRTMTLDPLHSHRYHCPYVVGFPRDGLRKSTPIWQTIATKLLAHPKQPSGNSTVLKNDHDKSDGDNEDEAEAKTNRILELLQSGISSRIPRQETDDLFANLL